ncbi:MAG: RagB/SusD family nutrient uptake outer membrane protein [Prevotella sp.]|jgi:hypothetical protein|nr:RagB/SusD family nutrient uptake outer membrane protein [Prevotella sp.]
MKKILNNIFMAALLIAFMGCSDDYLNTAPTNATGAATAFETTENAAMVVNGLARIMVRNPSSTSVYQQGLGGEAGIKLWYGDFTGNTMTIPAGTSGSYGPTVDVASGNLHDNTSSPITSYPWWYYYQIVSNANSVLKYVDDATGPDSEKQRLKAQAFTYRAYAFTQLVQLYGNRWADSNNGATPAIVLRVEPTVTSLALSTMADTYKQIYDDLDEAISLFTTSGWQRDKDDFWTPTINVAYATYARAAINKLDYAKAIEMAVKARAGYPLMTVAEYKAGFFDVNREWIWGGYTSADQTMAYYSYHANIAYDGYAARSTASTKCIEKSYYEQIPATDIRKALFLDATGYSTNATNGMVLDNAANKPLLDFVKAKVSGSALNSNRIFEYMQFKIACKATPGIGYLNFFRSSEMYLIEAEAQCKLGTPAGATRAQQLLVELTKDSGRDPNFTCTETGAALFEKIKFMSQIELWGEGFDWFMTKRWNDKIIHKSYGKGGNYHINYNGEFGPEEKNKQTWMIPLLETDYNPLAKGLAN